MIVATIRGGLALLAVTVLAGCTTAPVADFADFAFPARGVCSRPQNLTAADQTAAGGKCGCCGGKDGCRLRLNPFRRD